MIHPGTTIPSFDNKTPRVQETASVVPGEQIGGDRPIWTEASVWYNCAPRFTRVLNG